MTDPVVIEYPLDLTGQSPNNLVIGEPHDLATATNRAFVPNHGPFYTRGMVVRVHSSGQVLEPEVHYKACQLFPEATLKTGMEICSVIVIVDETLGSEFDIDYQTLGGDYSASVYAIKQMIDALSLDERPITWGAILGKPSGFPPAAHLHDLGDGYGFEFLVAALEGIRQAILQGDVVSHDDIYQYIDHQDQEIRDSIAGFLDALAAHINDHDNPHETTKDHVGLGLVENYPPASTAEAIAGSAIDRYMSPDAVRAAVYAQVGQAFAAHIADFNNPHQTTKDQVGLGLVSNYRVATLAEALEGTSTTTYLTPFLAQAMINQALAVTPGDTPPVAAFTQGGSLSVTQPANHVLTFTNTSTAGTNLISSYLWNFGDGTTSTAQNPPAHTYSSIPVGTTNITVQLTVTDSDGLTSTISHVYALTKAASSNTGPTANFTTSGATTVVEGSNHVIAVSNTSVAGNTAITGWDWDWGDGTAHSTAQNPAPHSYTTPIGTTARTITLTTTDANGLTSVKTVALSLIKTAASPPIANFTTSGTLTTQFGGSVFITPTDTTTLGSGHPIVSWSWNWGDGSPVSTGKTPGAHEYHPPVGTTSYNITLTVTDSIGKTDTQVKTVNLTQYPNLTLGLNTLSMTNDRTTGSNPGTAYSDYVTPTPAGGSGTYAISWSIFNNGGRATAIALETSGNTARLRFTSPNLAANFSTDTVTAILRCTVTSGGDTATKDVSITVNVRRVFAPMNLTFESGDVGWDKGAAISIISGSGAYAGSWRARMVYNANASSGFLQQGAVAIAPGQTATVACRVKPSGASDSVGGKIRIIWLNATGGFLSNVQGNDINVRGGTTTYRVSSVSAVAPAGAAYFTFQGEGYIADNQTAGKIDFDNFEIGYVGPPGVDDPPTGGGGGCVATDMFMDADRRAGDIHVGEWIDGAGYEPMGIVPRQVRGNRVEMQPAMRLVTESGIAIVASTTTPFTLKDGTTKYMPDMQGELVLVDDDGVFRWEAVTDLYSVGMREVVLFNIDDQSFYAGEVANRRIVSHNMAKNYDPYDP